MLKAEIVSKATTPAAPASQTLGKAKKFSVHIVPNQSARMAMPSLPTYFAPSEGKTKINLPKAENCRKPRMRRESRVRKAAIFGT